MTSDETTVVVPAGGYDVPDDTDEIEIGITAFEDKVYLKFPRFDRSGSNDFCVSAEPLFRALVGVSHRNNSLSVDPIYRKLGVIDEERLWSSDPDEVLTTIIGDPTDTSYAHLSLVEEFATTVGGVKDDDYWRGYRQGVQSVGERLSWSEIAWKKFDRSWHGNESLMRDAGVWLAEQGLAVCNRSRALFPIPEWTTPTGSYVSTVSDVFDGTCPSCGADKDKNWECTSSSNRNRVPDKYQCTECGHTASGITTG